MSSHSYVQGGLCYSVWLGTRASLNGKPIHVEADRPTLIGVVIPHRIGIVIGISPQSRPSIGQRDSNRERMGFRRRPLRQLGEVAAICRRVDNAQAAAAAWNKDVGVRSTYAGEAAVILRARLDPKKILGVGPRQHRRTGPPEHAGGA